MRILSLITFPLLASLPSLTRCGEVTPLAEKPAPDAKVEARVANLLAKVKASLRPLKGATFEMGDWGNEEGVPYDFDAHSRPLHKVTLDGFSMMAYKVTFEDFDVFTDATGNERIHMRPRDLEERAPKRPAGVSWHGAKAYCGWLANMTKLPFALPTEAQWEYAARSGGKKFCLLRTMEKLREAEIFRRNGNMERKSLQFQMLEVIRLTRLDYMECRKIPGNGSLIGLARIIIRFLPKRIQAARQPGPKN